MEVGFLNHNPAWRAYKYSDKRKEKLVANEETMRKIITALENESINYERKSIHVQRNVVKITGEALQARFSTETFCVEQQAEVVQLHRRPEKRLDRKRRQELLELVDAEARLQDDLSLASFIAGFRLACGIAHELG